MLCIYLVKGTTKLIFARRRMVPYLFMAYVKRRLKMLKSWPRVWTKEVISELLLRH